MTIKSGAVWNGLFVCKGATGVLSTPSLGPTGTLYVDGTINAATVTISGSNPYKFSVTLPALTEGQQISMYITATIDTVATASVIAEESIDGNYLTSGPGSQTVTLTIEYNSAVVDNAAVWITTDSAGANVIAGTKYSNMNGLVTFYLDTGTYYVWATKSGIDFGNPNPITVA